MYACCPRSQALACPEQPHAAPESQEVNPNAPLLTSCPEAPSSPSPPPPCLSFSGCHSIPSLLASSSLGTRGAWSRLIPRAGRFQRKKKKKTGKKEWQFDTALSQLKWARRVTRAWTLMPCAQSQLRLHLPRFMAAAPCWGTRCLC